MTQPLSPASDDSSYLAVPPLRGPQARRQRFADAAAADQYDDYAMDDGAGFAGEDPHAWCLVPLQSQRSLSVIQWIASRPAETLGLSTVHPRVACDISR